ncbi:OLC1v1031036C1 [Oldenlandia corymbosa var. corymbosa]|uniref:OLC1v1031036C1 n=1 Tax=Oldenlandia corymbosa var. corymbosa TaxID=529605 RepID=A0AAV1CKT8_OLDCO|nr:OLC1v1031036C1 [Oldenlandia corymbosa var. corymbosa]
METSVLSFVCFSVFIALLSTALFRKRLQSTPKKRPPSPWKLPIIGHLHHLKGAPPHHTLRRLSQKYGALIQLQLGEIPAIVVSSPRFAKEVLKTQDVTFANRGEMLAGKIMLYNCTDIACAPYGEYWRQMRKICTLELLNTKNVRSYGSIRLQEAHSLIRSIKDLVGSSTTINLTKELAEYTSSMVVRAAFGKVNKDDQDAFLELMKESLPLSSAFEISDLFPSLKFLHPFLSNKGELMRIHYKLDIVMDKIIDQYLDKDLASSKVASTSEQQQGNEDLIDVLLRVKDNNELQFPITKNNIKAVMLDVFSGGTETSSSTVEWAMAELIRHPEVMAKLQDEIRESLGENKTIKESDIQELSYLKLVVKETLRLHPPAPLLVPRESRMQTEIDGYIIPNKTRVIVNAWAIARDPEYWTDPESFKPERFENSGTDFTGNHFEYIPFGSGKRMCPGMSFGLANVYLPLALLLYYFDWKLPNGQKPDGLDMAETVGVTSSRSNHLLLIAKLYDPSL